MKIYNIYGKQIADAAELIDAMEKAVAEKANLCKANWRGADARA